MRARFFIGPDFSRPQVYEPKKLIVSLRTLLQFWDYEAAQCSFATQLNNRR